MPDPTGSPGSAAGCARAFDVWVWMAASRLPRDNRNCAGLAPSTFLPTLTASLAARRRYPMTPGLQTRDMVEIASGLAEGQVVVGP